MAHFAWSGVVFIHYGRVRLSLRIVCAKSLCFHTFNHLSLRVYYYDLLRAYANRLFRFGSYRARGR